MPAEPPPDKITLDEFFSGQDTSRLIFEAVHRMLETIGPAQAHIRKSQIAFNRRKAFAWVWIPGRYLRGKTAPLVLSLSFRRHDASPRWKEIVEPASGRFTHHLELYSPTDIDEEVRLWLQEAWMAAF